MGLWDGLESAEVYDQGQYFPPGQWVVEINRCLNKRSKKSGQDLFIVECNVITSSRPDAGRGSRYSWCQGMKNRNVAMNAIYDFMLRVFDLPREDKGWRAREFDPYIVATMDRVTGADNILGERIVNLSTWNKKKKEKPDEDFTIHEWELFDYAGASVPPPPDWVSVRVMRGGYAGYGAPPPPPAAAPHLDPSGKWQLVNGAWVAYAPPPPAYVPPPPPPPSPPVAAGPPPGAPRSQDGRYWWNGAIWVLI